MAPQFFPPFPAVLPTSLNTTIAATFCPHASLFKPTTAHSLISGNDKSSRSTSSAETFSPPVLIISADILPSMKYTGPPHQSRPCPFACPAPLIRLLTATSPVLNQPSTNPSTVALSFRQYSLNTVWPRT